jgi:hypothetical protein
MYWFKFDGNITGFFRFGDRYPASPLIEQEVRVAEGGQGYDGQFFLAIALDPLLLHEGSAASLDFPRYRYRRILYPLLGFLIGFGRASLIPYALVVLNVACIPVLVLCVVSLISRVLPEPITPSEGRAGTAQSSARSIAGHTPGPAGTGAESRWRKDSPPHPGLAQEGVGTECSRLGLLVLAPLGVWVSLALSTCDLLGSTLLFAALYFAAKKRVSASALLIACAALTRETYLAVAVMLSVAPLLRAGRRRIEWRYLLSTLPAAVWLAYGGWRFPAATDRVGEHFGVPLGGVLAKLSSLTGDAGAAHAFDALVFVLLLVVAIAGGALVALSLFPLPGALRALGGSGLHKQAGEKPERLRVPLRERGRRSGLHKQAGDTGTLTRSAPGTVFLLCTVPYLAILLFGTSRMLGYYAHHARIFMDVFLLMFLAGEASRARWLTRGVMAVSALASAAFVLHYTLG